MTDGAAERRPDGREYVDGVPRLLVLAKARSILDAFTLEESQLTIAELAARTGLPASTCFRLVRNLAHDGLLERIDDRYRIGLSIVRWASSALESRSLVAVATPTLEWLRNETGESALLRVRDGDVAVLVAMANSRHSVVRRLRIGEVTPLHAGSSGKIFLAFDTEASAAIHGRKLESFTERTVTDRKRLATEVTEIRAAGYAVSAEERNDGVAGISAPIYDSRARMVGSVGVTGPVGRMGGDVVERYSPIVIDAGIGISKELGHRT